MKTNTEKIILKLQTAPLAPEQFYGPFDSDSDAYQWMIQQPNGLNFVCIKLRHPLRWRNELNDWYFQNSDNDFFPEWEA